MTRRSAAAKRSGPRNPLRPEPSAERRATSRGAAPGDCSDRPCRCRRRIERNREVPSPRLNTRRRTSEYATIDGEQDDRQRQVERQVGSCRHRSTSSTAHVSPLSGLTGRGGIDVDDPRQPPLDAWQASIDAERRRRAGSRCPEQQAEGGQPTTLMTTKAIPVSIPRKRFQRQPSLAVQQRLVPPFGEIADALPVPFWAGRRPSAAAVLTAAQAAPPEGKQLTGSFCSAAEIHRHGHPGQSAVGYPHPRGHHAGQPQDRGIRPTRRRCRAAPRTLTVRSWSSDPSFQRRRGIVTGTVVGAGIVVVADTAAVSRCRGVRSQ